MMNQPFQKQETERINNAERTFSGKVYMPAVDIYETDNAIVLMADMPGVDESSIDVTVDQNVLVIQGKVNQTHPEGMEAVYSEFDYGDFYRTFTLGDEIDRNKINATFKNGVLTLQLPKAEPEKPKKINVQVN
jgi:HSP20 family molecular chaperone IbpA